MSIYQTVKQKLFSQIGSTGMKNEPLVYGEKPVAGMRLSNRLITYLIGLSNFQDMSEEEIYEQLYIWEPEIGGSVDRISTLTRQAYQGVYIDEGEGVEKEKDLLKLAKTLSTKMDIKSYFETMSELYMIFGNVYIRVKGDHFTILPNQYVSLIDKEDVLTAGTGNRIITEANFLVYREGFPDQEIIPMSEIIHLKYKNTPTFCMDNKKRITYGLYSVSPLHRTIISIWWKRQTEIIDIMWRWRNVPREHHSIDGSIFSMDKYEGTLEQRREASTTDLESYIAKYASMMMEQMPDQGYVTSDSVKIDIVQSGGSRTNYMNTNELLTQLEGGIWTALNIPSSIVNGKSAGSYASELVVSNYVSAKVIQMAEKIGAVMLDVLKEKIRKIDSTLPVDKLAFKLELSMAASELEVFRQMAIMGALNVFTDTEIREVGGYEALTEEQKKEIQEREQQKVENQRAKSVGDVLRDASSINGPQYPETPQSNQQHKRDAGDQVTDKVNKNS